MVSVEIDPPPSARLAGRSSGPSLTLPLAVVALIVGLGAGFWLGRVTARPGAAAASTSAASAPAAPATAQVVAAPAPAPAAAQAAAQATPAAAAPGAAPAPIPAAATTTAVTPAALSVAPGGGPRRLVATVSGALEDSIATALGPEDRARAPELTQVINRLLVWDLHVSRDGRRGDRLEVLWEPAAPAAPGLPANGEPVVVALRYASGKLGSVLSAYRFEPQGARWPRYFRADGREVELRLVDAPVADYEQVTSLLRDGRRHKGIDFKTPVGSPVVAPFDGVVERRNWHFSANGNCLDLRDPQTGRHAIFLHLDVVPKDMGVGRRVKKGEVVAHSGNSGHSFAPHLHYQLEDASGKVLDPFDVLKTERRGLASGDRAAFDAERSKLDAALTRG
jgi:murein DD-endopeptidase MepM/ murein hydrolase activator NlpD